MLVTPPNFIPFSAAAAAPLALDGSAHANSGSTASLGATITTTASNDIILAIITTNGGNVTGVSGGGLTWSFYERATPGANQVIEIWTAIAASPLSSQTITATTGAANFMTLDVMAVKNVKTSSPFDPSGGFTVTGSGTALSINTTTSGKDVMVVVAYRFGSTGSPTNGAGWTLVSGANFQLAEYKIVSTPQTGLSGAVGTGSADKNGGCSISLVQA